MSIPHARSGDVIDIRPLANKLSQSKTQTLLKTESLEVLRLVLPAGKTISEHKAPGEITVQCLEGRVEFTSPTGTQSLQAGEMLYLDSGEPHAVQSIADSSILLTILLSRKNE